MSRINLLHGKPFGRIEGVQPPPTDRGANPKERLCSPSYIRESYDVKAKKFEANIDWVTLSKKEETGEWLRAVSVIVGKLIAKGEIPQEVSANGYEGQRTGGFTWMRNPQGNVYISSSSETSQEAFYTFAPMADNCSRLDLEVTVQFDRYVPRLARTEHDKLEAMDEAGETRVANGRPPIVRLASTAGGGQTLYLGDRTSRVFGRMYDKSRDPSLSEEGKYEFRNCWRWEVETKDDYSRSALLFCKEKWANDPEYRLPQNLIAGTVLGWFADKSVIVPDLDTELERLHFSVQAVAKLTSIEKTLVWIMRQVRPAVERAIDWGFRDEILIALGLAKGVRSDLDYSGAIYSGTPPKSLKWSSMLSKAGLL